MIYTSSFAHVRIALPAGMRAVSIAQQPPQGWPEDDVCPSLKPWPFMLDHYARGHLTDYGFEMKYRDYVLFPVSAGWILEHYDGCVLCSHEPPEVFSHRRVVRKWIKEKTAVDVQELGWKPEPELSTIPCAQEAPRPQESSKPKEVRVEQLSLFA